MANKLQAFDARLLDRAGLNRQAVFNIDDLPAEIIQPIRNTRSDGDFPWRQLILIGHGGKRLWESVKPFGTDSENPIDDFTVRVIGDWFAISQPDNAFEIIYPGCEGIGLQGLGRLAGWHHASPFMVGIDGYWGTWYAYRALVAADTDFEATRPVPSQSPCDRCGDRACIAACPGAALAEGRYDSAKCIAYRRRGDSKCRATCLARVACPVGSEHRYCDEQLCHAYSHSLKAIERYL